jgi:hypothetical protein
MKTIFTLLLATVFTSAFAYNEGKLTITVPAKNLQVYVDNRLYQDNDQTIVLNNIQPGNHTIKIYRASRNGSGKKARNGRFNQENDLVYSSSVYVRPSTHVDVMINRFGKALVDERSLSDRNSSWNDDDYNDGYGNGGYGNGGYNSQIMNDGDFNQFIQKIRTQWIGKINTARDGLNAHYFNVYQVRQVLQLFSAEKDKLELAKLAYRNTVDRQNFRQLYELFTWQSQAELDRYISTARF